MPKALLFCLLLMAIACNNSDTTKDLSTKVPKEEGSNETTITKKNSLPIFEKAYIAHAFDYPVGPPDAKGYYNAQGFGENLHLGDDWNSVTGGNSDIGDPIYSIANGYVNFAEDIGGGWGNVIRIWHQTKEGKIVESLYAHCDEILVNKGQHIKKGDKIATIGNADGQYFAHLHFEIRDDVELSIGGGYSRDTKGYLDPTQFIKNNRK